MRMPRTPLVTLIIVLDVLIFLMWNYPAKFSAEFMYNNFLVSWDSLAEGRWWTLFGSGFSHSTVLHLIINMFVLNSFGRILEMSLGKRFFIGFYLFAMVVSSFGHAAVSNFILHQPDLPALGASGAVAGCVLLFALLFPEEKLLLFGLIPLPAIWGAVAFVGLDVWGLVAQAEGGGLPIGHGAHLGGAFAGLLTYLFVLRPRIRKMREARARVQKVEESSGVIDV